MMSFKEWAGKKREQFKKMQESHYKRKDERAEAQRVRDVAEIQRLKTETKLFKHKVAAERQKVAFQKAKKRRAPVFGNPFGQGPSGGMESVGSILGIEPPPKRQRPKHRKKRRKKGKKKGQRSITVHY